jgi:hypothetical protein
VSESCGLLLLLVLLLLKKSIFKCVVLLSLSLLGAWGLVYLLPAAAEKVCQQPCV